ncbi:hypothetical protein H6G81_19660 [Scytonema hofmannii FACHB-248]|uniref:Uncharacterized protein n=1 Tax=Scytonema hofmannii FACHB-248 TaxID=1842502 RepID=A0ABR8GTX8_9CYAN|nr:MULTISPECIES: hypothetical protein [Nostocales]MBD2606689.1 hypothetical protein [Scytonema hofmannii FACHB-248]
MAGFEIWSEITTQETDFDGARHTATSGWDSNTAPENYVINRDQVKVEWISQNGSENSYDLTYDDWVELVPGTSLKFPRTIIAVNVFIGLEFLN